MKSRKPMIRQGKYTKRLSRGERIKRGLKRRWLWFRNLKWWQKTLLIFGPILVILILIPIFTYFYYANDIADAERLMNRNNTGIVLTDSSGKPFYSVGRAEHRQVVPLDQIADSTKKALIASEDKNFYDHGGFSFPSIVRALYGNIGGGATSGASTLTQQLAKNTLLSSNQTFLRKYQEVVISIAIEQRYSKDQILEMYLNSVYYGEKAFGIEDAAKVYFNKAPKDLTLAESAMLVGLLPAPSAYSPISGNPTYAKQRQTTVLNRMVANNSITTAEKDAALAEELTYAKPTDQNDSVAPHFAQMVLDELYKQYGEETVTRSGYQVKTTLDLTLQQQLQDNTAKNLPYIQRSGGSNSGGVAIDPRTGQIRALVGSVDWNNPEWGKVNMATTARQPGSSFKPIYYSQALADGVITPSTILKDVPTDFGGGYRPLNADRRFRGDVTVRSAINQSLNIPSVEVMQKLGLSKSITAAKNLGITTIDPNKNYGLSLALGSAEVPLLQMTNAYAAFANQGQQYDTTTIQSINDKFNTTIFTATPQKKEAISAEGAYLISSILSDNNARAVAFGSSLTVPGRTAAVKTGTTDDSRDAWTVGYTPQLAIGVWVGNNNNQVMANGGAGMAGPIWRNTIQQALAGVPDTPFVKPSSVLERFVCYSNGGIASSSGPGTYREYFLVTALPTATCTPVQPEKPEDENKPPEQPDPTTTNPPTQTGDGGGTPPTNGGGGGTTTPGGGGTTNPNPGGTGPTTPPVTPPTTPGGGTTTPPAGGSGGGTTPTRP